MNCNIAKSILNGTIDCPASKAYTHRAIFLAALAKGRSTIINALKSNDIVATIDACTNFGSTINHNKNEMTIQNNGLLLRSTFIDAKNSGTTIRIAASISSLFDKQITLTGDNSLNQRPMSPLLKTLTSLGAKCSSYNGKPPLTITGKISGGEAVIQGNISSQFISSLLMIAPCLKEGLIIMIKDHLVSKQYVDATLAIMAQFGVVVNVISKYKKYSVNFQQYKATTVHIPSDYSSLSLLLSAAILVGNKLKIKTSQNDLPQVDHMIIDILNTMGVDIILDQNIISVNSPHNLLGGKFDLEHNPDLLPPVAILALKSNYPIEIFNVRHARYKETDRIAIISREFKKLGLLVKEKDDGMIIQNTSGVLKSANLNPENDHRLFMAFCIAGMYIGKCTVSDSESINISYPNFIRDINKLGGKISKSM